MYSTIKGLLIVRSSLRLEVALILQLVQHRPPQCIEKSSAVASKVWFHLQPQLHGQAAGPSLSKRNVKEHLCEGDTHPPQKSQPEYEGWLSSAQRTDLLAAWGRQDLGREQMGHCQKV